MAGLSLRTKFGYGVGHIFNDLCSSLWFTYLLIYFHNVERFPNTLAGVLLLIGQVSFYASPSFGEAYRDRRLTINFELWVEIFCVPTCFHMRIPNPCLLSVCLSVCPHPEKRNHHSFVNMSPTLVIDTSMERSSRVLHHGNPKISFFFKKVQNLNFDFWQRAEIILVSSISVLHYYASPTSGEAYTDRRLTINFELWVEIFCVPTCFHVRIPKPCLSVRLSAPREKISS